MTWHQVRRALGIIGYAIAALVFAAVAFTVLAPRATHGEALEVLTGSMRPTIQPGSLVFIRAVDPREIHAGDIVTYQVRSGESPLVTHRVIRVASDPGAGLLFTLKGDANNVADPKPVPAAAIHGRVWLAVPYAGQMRALAGTRTGYLVLVLLPALWYAAEQVRAGLRRRSRGEMPAGKHARSGWPQVESSQAMVAVFQRDALDGVDVATTARLLHATTVELPDGTVALVRVHAREQLSTLAALLQSLVPESLSIDDSADPPNDGAAMARSIAVDIHPGTPAATDG